MYRTMTTTRDDDVVTSQDGEPEIDRLVEVHGENVMIAIQDAIEADVFAGSGGSFEVMLKLENRGGRIVSTLTTKSKANLH